MLTDNKEPTCARCAELERQLAEAKAENSTLRQYDSDHWDELVKRGWATETEKYKLRSLVAPSKLFADLRAQLAQAESNGAADKRRLDWLIAELNELHSNVTRDVFGWASDDEGDLSVEAIDAAMQEPS